MVLPAIAVLCCLVAFTLNSYQLHAPFQKPLNHLAGKFSVLSAQTSVSGMIGVLEDGAAGKLPLQGTWHDYKKETVPW